jgi:hypothetical protein
MSESSRRIANVLAHSRIKTMSDAISSCSDEEGESSLYRSHNQSSSIDTEADESDDEINNNNNTKQIPKARRAKKTRKTSFTLVNLNHIPPISRTNIRKDDQKRRSSSNDDDDSPEINGMNDETFFNNRRLKSFALKKRDHFTTTTTTDDDTTKHHRYHALDILEANRKSSPSEGSSLTPIIFAPTTQIPTRKTNRFQVKSIRKSQQQQILLANSATAKSSNDDDCSIPVQRTKVSLKQLLIERKHTNTPTTDGENPTTNTDNIVNGALSALKTVENGGGAGQHRVRFQVTQHKKTESAAEEEKLPVPTTTLPTPAPPSSAASAQGEVS